MVVFLLPMCYTERIKLRGITMYKILFVCHGNICRSPLAESVFAHMLREKGLSHKYSVNSAATSTEELGNPPHPGTVKKLREMGIPLVPHRARQITWADYCQYDLILAMDDWNIRNLRRMLRNDPEGKLHKLLSFADSQRDIADPWYTGNFDATYADVTEGCQALLTQLEGVDNR